MMSDKIVGVKAVFRDEASQGFKSLASNAASATQAVNTTGTKARGASMGLNILAGAAGGLAVMMAGKLVSSAGSVAMSFVNVAAEAETLTLQFKTLLGSEEAAIARMEELKKLAASTPFKLTEIANASRVLETLTGGALSTAEGLTMVGDTAAATGADFQNLAMHVGRAYDGLQSNRPVGEALMRLQELGIVSGETRQQIEDLQGQARGADAWKVLQEQLNGNSGAMKDLSGTWAGLYSTFQDTMEEIQRRVMSGGALDSLKGALTDLTGTMEELIDSGAFEDLGSLVGGLAEGLAKLVGLLKDTVVGWRHLLGMKPEHQEKIDAINAETDALTKQKNMLEARIAAQERSRDRGSTGAYGFNPAILEELQRQLKGTNAAIESSEKELTDFYNKIYESGGNALTGMGSGASSGSGKPKKTGGGGGSTPKAAAGGPSDLELLNEALYESAKKAFEERVAAEQEFNETSAELMREHTRIGMDQREIELANLQEWYDEKQAIVEGNAEAEAHLREIHEARLADIDAKYKEEQKTSLEDWKNTAISAAAEVASAAINMSQHRAQREKSIAIKRVRDSKKTEEEKQKEIEKIEREAFEENKKRSMLQILIDGAVGAAKTIANVGWPAAAPLLVVQGIATAAALATVAAQKYQDGGIIEGSSTSGDQQLIAANAGEVILNRRQTANVFRAINSGRLGGGGPVSMRTGDIIIYGGASAETVDQIRRSQEDQVAEMHEGLIRYKAVYGEAALV